MSVNVSHTVMATCYISKILRRWVLGSCEIKPEPKYWCSGVQFGLVSVVIFQSSVRIQFQCHIGSICAICLVKVLTPFPRYNVAKLKITPTQRWVFRSKGPPSNYVIKLTSMLGVGTFSYLMKTASTILSQ